MVVQANTVVVEANSGILGKLEDTARYVQSATYLEQSATSEQSVTWDGAE